ncbi:MAG: sensor histidine kinase [Anaerolineales bacterium]|nr:sensor histidine kinase [Anaerolineales bacterium]
MDQLTFLVFFIYGLAFFGMGITMALESGRSPALAEARVLRPLAAFGLIHGTHEWMESYLIQARSFGTPLPDWLPWLRLVFLVASFTSLFLYGVQMLLLVSPYNPRKRIFRFSVFGAYALFIVISIMGTYSKAPISTIDMLDGLARYLLAVPAAMLAALALRAQALGMFHNKRTRLGTSLAIASFWFAIYTLTQFFVHPMDMFPARYVNEDTFLLHMGFPIQLIRTITAVMITYGLLRATQYMEEERKTELFAAQRSRLEALEQQEEIRRELLRHTVQAQEDERTRIARELHDETSQILTAFTLELATLRELAKRRPQVKTIVDRLQEHSHQMSQGLYNMVHELRPAQLDDLGLVPAIKSLLENEFYPKGMKVVFQVTGAQKRLDSLIETVLYRVTQEALTNVNRHAETNQAIVRLDYAPTKVTLGVLDSGRGFDPDEPLRPPRGWGLEGMRERVEAVGGQLILYSAPEHGTTVEVVIPMEEGE